MSVMVGHDQPETPVSDEVAAELDKLGPAPVADESPAPADEKPAKRKSRSGTSGAERARRARGASDTAPKPAAKPAAARTSSRTTQPKIAAGMAQMYSMVGLGVSLVPSGPAVAGPHVGKTITGAVGVEIMGNAAQLGQMWEEAAKADPRVREALEKLLAVSLVGQIVAAHLPIVLAGLVAAGTMPPLEQMMGQAAA